MSLPQQPPTDPQQPQPKRKRRTWLWIVGGIVALFVIIGIANGGNSTPTTATPATTPAAGTPAAPVAAAPAAASSDVDHVTYEVTGAGVKGASVTYVKDDHLGQQQDNAARLPWSKQIDFANGMFSMQPLTLVAQSKSGGNGTITCRIMRNGEEVTSSTSSGPYAVVTCSGS